MTERDAAADPHLDLLDEARHAEAVAERTQRRHLTEADAQDATLRGSIEQLAEADTTLVVDLTVGRRLRGRVRALSADHVVLLGDHGRAWLRIDAITTVAADPAVPGVRVRAGGGERRARPPLPPAGSLGEFVEHGADVELVLDGGASVRGTVVRTGTDVLTLARGAGPGRADHVLVNLRRAALVTAT